MTNKIRTTTKTKLKLVYSAMQAAEFVYEWMNVLNNFEGTMKKQQRACKQANLSLQFIKCLLIILETREREEMRLYTSTRD